jgi:hypothetical protein
MIERNIEQTKELEKSYYSYIRTVYSLLNYSLNTNIEKDHIQVKQN